MVNFDELKSYEDYSKLTTADILEFMKTKPAEDVLALKEFCSEKKITKKEDGTEKERVASFFEIRNWVLDKYYPGLRTSQKSKNSKPSFIDSIMAL